MARVGRILIVALLAPAGLLAFVPGAARAAEPPAAPKTSSFAPAADIAGQINFFVKRSEESLADKGEYDEAKQARTLKDGATLSVLALALALHDEDHALKGSAPAVLTAAQKLSDASGDYDRSKEHLAEIKAALAGAVAAPAATGWRKTASLEALMKQVPLVNAGLKRGLQPARFERLATETAGHAATLAIIAQAAIHDDTVAGDDDQWREWFTFCAEMRDSAGALNAAARAKDRQAAVVAAERLAKSCDDCHVVFRDGEE